MTAVGPSRRAFLSGLAACGLGGGLRAGSAGGRLRLGVLADLHVARENAFTLKNLEKALRAYDAFGADAVLCCGDLTNLGYIDQLEAIAETWFKVFPGNRRSDGAPVVQLFHYGDHDMSGEKYSQLESERKRFADEAARRAAILTMENRAAVWERCFREQWKPLMVNNVGGFTFVRAHFTVGEEGNPNGNRTPGLAECLSALSADPGRPFFYLQHRIPRNTAGGPNAWGQDDGTTTQVLSRYPNCIAFCGHGHVCSVSDRNLWQGAFTCLEVPSLRYCMTAAGRENGYAIGDRPPRPPYLTMPPLPAHLKASDPLSGSHQGLFVEVGEAAVEVRRWDFAHDCDMAPPWVIPLPTTAERPYAPEVRARTEPVPSFPAGAKVSLRTASAEDRGGRTREFVSVEFPAAAPTRANDYEVRLELRRGDVVRVLDTRRVYSPAYLWGAKKERERPVACLWPRDEMPAQGDLRFVVEPLSSYERRGAALTCAVAQGVGAWRAQ